MSLPIEEQWRPVVGYEGLYEVSDQGRVRSVDRLLPGRWGHQRRRGCLIAPQPHPSDGRKRVPLSREGHSILHLVYRLVLAAFVGPCPQGMEGCHNDGDASNDRLDNLRWDTKSENARDAVRHGVHPKTRKTHCPRGHALVLPNLVPTAWAKGFRGCLACSRARSYARWATGRGEEVNLQALSDEHYARIMRQARTPE